MGEERKGREKTAVLICGDDGYIGYALKAHLKEKGYKVDGIDNLSRRKRVHAEGGESLIPRDVGDLPNDVLQIPTLKPYDAVIHLAQQPSAPWSMANEATCIETQMHNVASTLHLLWLMRESPKTHMIKLGSMGEYGTPNCNIPEGFIDDGPLEGMMFPRKPGSFYHLSKVFDSMNIDFACRMWGLSCTDIMQGVVFGIEHNTRFDYDDYFGTVINRFCVQAIAGVPLTVYGKGGQTRGYLPLKDSLECITLALENPSEGYRVFNQFARCYSVREIAKVVQKVYDKPVVIGELPNPRVEEESHYYNPANEHLRDLGYDPQWHLRDEVRDLLKKIEPYKDNVIESAIQPRTTWR